MKKIYISVVLICLIISGCGGVLGLVKNRLPSPHKVEGGYLFQLDKPGASSVQIVGNFNEWGKNENGVIKDPEIGKFTKNSEGIWQIILKLPQGRHIYKMVIDRNSWIKDPNNRDEDSSGNSLIIVD